VLQATELMQRLAALGIYMDVVGRTLDDNGIASFDEAYHHVLADLAATAQSPGHPREKGTSDAPRQRISARRS
jgi:transaldolase